MSPLAPRRGTVRNRRGTAAVEFALTAPLLALLMIGTLDVAPSLMVRFKLGSTTAAVADLATQAATVQFGDITNFFGAGSDVMAPFAGTPLSLRVSNVATDGSGRAFIYWSCASGSLSPVAATTTETSSTPMGGIDVTSILQISKQTQGTYAVNGTNTSVVVVESAYTYKAPAGLILPSPQNLTSAAFAVPRVSTYIGPTTGQAGFVPPIPTKIGRSYNYASNGVNCSFGY